MAKHRSSALAPFIAESLSVIAALSIHLWYLLHTTFVDWPEMLVYPWFLTKNLLYYRDIVLAYVPGAYYILYALYNVFGFSVSSERLIAYLFIGITDLFIYFVARNLTKKRLYALFALVFYVLWQPAFSGNSIWYETLLTPVYLLGYLSVVRYFRKPSVARIVFTGSVLAVASLIKQTAVWSIAVVWLTVWLDSKDKKAGFVHAAIAGIMPVAANLFVWGMFALSGAGREFGYWAYGFLFDLTQANSYYAQFPARNELAHIGPAFVALAIVGFLRFRERNIRLLILWFAALIAAGLPRWGIHRLQPALAFAAVGLGIFADYFMQVKNNSRRGILILSALFVMVGTYRSIRVFVDIRDHMQPHFFSGEYQALLDFSKNNLNNKPLFVLGNYDYLYFGLNQRPVVVPWVPMYPWNAQIPGVQDSVIRQLEMKRVPYVLYVPYHGNAGYYEDYVPESLLLYVENKYEKIAPLPIAGGWLYQRK